MKGNPSYGAAVMLPYFQPSLSGRYPNFGNLENVCIMALARVGSFLLQSFSSNIRQALPSLCSRTTVGADYLTKSRKPTLCLSFSPLLTQARSIGAFAARPAPGLLQDARTLSAPSTSLIQKRGVVKWSHRTGKRKTVKSVIKRFMYLDWTGRGMWIRPRTGKYKRRWRKSSRRKARLNQHVFTNATQSRMLDKMATKFWRKQFHFIDDMYADFHVRDNFPLTSRPPPAP